MKAKPIFIIEMPEAYHEHSNEIRTALLKYTNNEYHVVMAVYNREDIKFSVLNQLDAEYLTEAKLNELEAFIFEQNHYVHKVNADGVINKNQEK